ncbi:MAG: hypothetical protein PHQ80_01230 [Candidatus ainarchaeum sp.]|nr:hypothetical protein [Candidatus ainarchaeum sp.]MDD5095945.1 hypothetical protein [Candidatus ainarchaeum sp.]
MGKNQARSDAERDSGARKGIRTPRRGATAKIIAAGLMLAPNPAHARSPSQPAVFQPPASGTSGTSDLLSPQPEQIQYSEAFRDADFTCETGGGMVRISGNVEGGKIEFPAPADLGAVRGIYRTGSRIRVLSDNYLITARASGTDAINVSLPQGAKGALSAWLSTENTFYILSSDGNVHATNPEDTSCPWYSGGPFRTVEGARLMEVRGLLAIVQGSATAVILVKVVPGGAWDSLSVRLNFQPEGEPSVSMTPTGFKVVFGNCEVALDIPGEGEMGSVLPIVTRHEPANLP